MKVTHGTLDIPNDPTPCVIARPKSQKDYCVLWLQGWRSTIEKHEEHIARMAKQTGMTFAMIDYAGHGSHPIPLEDTTREQQFNEVLVAYDALQAEGFKHIIVVGMSFGGYLTALLTSKRAPYAVILRAPAIYEDVEFSMSYPERDARHETYQMFKKTVTPTSDLAALKAIQDFNGSVYVIEHEIDSVVPRNIPRAYFDVAKRGNYLVVPATEHSPAMMEHPEAHFRYIQTTITYVLELMRQESAVLSPQT